MRGTRLLAMMMSLGKTRNLANSSKIPNDKDALDNVTITDSRAFHAFGSDVISLMQAKVLTWSDLTETQLLYILQSSSKYEAREKLQQAMKLIDTDDDLKAEILLDLHFNTLLFAQEQGFSIEKISTLVSLVKIIHEMAAGERQPLERSWEHAKSQLLRHTVQRPPFSMAMFSLSDLHMITQYFLHTYYKHYKLYQYAFTPNYIVDLEQITNDDVVELPPPLPSLKEARTQEERDADLLKLQLELEEIERKICQSEVLAREAAIAASIEAAYRGRQKANNLGA
ncbi:unnamed protein product [Calypogeia fissa]